MTGRSQRSRTVLVMWEYSCEHSPLWSRSDDLGIGDLDARDLGLPEDLREDLADWNRRCERAADPDETLADPVTPQGWRRLGAEAFALAARAQRGLGDDWTVWCLAGGGDGGLGDAGGYGYEVRTSGPPGPTAAGSGASRSDVTAERTGMVLRSGGPVEWGPQRVAPALDRFEPALRRDVRAWIGAADRLPPGEHRAQGLALAGRLHAALDTGRVLFFGGDAPPAPLPSIRS